MALNLSALDGDIVVKWSSTVEPTTGKRSRTFEHSVPARWAALIAIVVATMLGVTIPALADPGDQRNPTATTRPDDQGDEHGQGVGQGSSQGGPNGQGRGNGTTTTTATTTTTGGSAATTTTPPTAPPAPVSSTTTLPVIPPVDWPPRIVDPLPPTLVVPITHELPFLPRILVCVA